VTKVAEKMVQVALVSPIAAPRAVQIGMEYLAWKSTALAPAVDNKACRRRRRIGGQKVSYIYGHH